MYWPSLNIKKLLCNTVLLGGSNYVGFYHVGLNQVEL